MKNYRAKLESGAMVEVWAENVRAALDVLSQQYLCRIVSIVRTNESIIKWCKRDEEATIPSRANPCDAGFDLYANENADIWIGGQAVIKTGISVELPDGYAGFIWPRSGMATKHMLNVHAGLIDTGFRGEVKVCLINHGDRPIEIRKGDRIAQMVVGPYLTECREVKFLGDSERGDSGFGSTGV